MSHYRPLLDAGDYSPHYGASGNDSDGPTLPYIHKESRPEKRLLRKLDLRVAFLVLIYIMNYMDCNNVAAARLRGFEEDLNMTGNQFNTLISILYLGYVFIQVPSSHKKPSIYLSSCMAIWGTITILTGASETYHTPLILRFSLGFVEAVFFPGAVFLLSRWYKRDELGLRTALLTCGSSISNAFSTLAASGILAGLNGKLGFSAWRWLFVVEGILTIVVAVSAIWILPDFPSTPSVWLTPDEHTLAKQRMEEDTAAGDEYQVKPMEYYSGLAKALVDWRVRWLGLTLCSMNASLSFGIFFPTLSATMGYNATISLLLCAPPWILGTATSFLVARHSDATGDRFWHITNPLLVGIVGYIIAISTMNTAVRYLSLCGSYLLRSAIPQAYVLGEVETRRSRRTNKLDGDIWQHRRIVLLAVQLGTFIRELVSHVHLDKRHMYCDVLGI
ncbi:hypothetical protein AZE42_02257 [Rhizopogon vesiculosus]|uniref:Major facilitator superfamily (MFS) profile domain-containing protein n=1 Tax=Rhizopogon vesiculosus TaxID=180088 RepID=A0A1J8QCP0_9AGAM|nr:hypothetical protein AZE42_02257 [Rhizopogon vesiculosus]